MPLRLYPLRFSFRAIDSLYFTAGKSANILRGAFGTILRGLACDAACPGARVCERRGECVYARMFEPRVAGATGPRGHPSRADRGVRPPSGLADWPRPFV